MIFILPDVKNRVSVKNNDKISVTWIFLDPIKNRVSVKSVYVEAVYLEALLYIHGRRNVHESQLVMHTWSTLCQRGHMSMWSSLK